LSQAHLAELTAAKTAARKIRRTAGVAKASAWTTGVLAGCTLLGVLFGDITALVLGAALMVVAVREGLLGARLSAFDESAPRRLAANQLILGAVIVVYAAWQGWNAWRSPGVTGAEELVGQSPGMDALLNDVGSLTRTITLGFYLVVAVGGALGTSLMALYYWRRTGMVRAFLSQQPDWIVQTMRAAA
jgi:hypothetical protein